MKGVLDIGYACNLRGCAPNLLLHAQKTGTTGTVIDSFSFKP